MGSTPEKRTFDRPQTGRSVIEQEKGWGGTFSVARLPFSFHAGKENTGRNKREGP